MAGRSKANRENIIILAHQVEAMARQKKLRPIVDYLGRSSRVVGTDEAVIPMLQAMAAKGLVAIREIPKGGLDGR